MGLIEHQISLAESKLAKADKEILTNALSARSTAAQLFEQGKYMDALERTVSAMRTLREFSNFEEKEFRHILAILLFDLSEIHFSLKDYKQSEKELEVLFKVLDSLIKEEADFFGHYHILAMELSTRILRSRKKVMDLLVKQKINADQLFEKVNSGVVAATDKLVESLRKVGQLLASAGDYKAALKFYSEAIKFSKRRTGRVGRREVKLTIEMAEIMMRVRHMRQRAKSLLSAILPHAISLETIELEEEILALTEIIENEIENESRWKAFLHKLSIGSKAAAKKEKKEQEAAKKETKKEAKKEVKKEDKKKESASRAKKEEKKKEKKEKKEEKPKK